MTKFCVFNTFEECKEAEHYDHNYQKAISLSSASGVDLNIIRENNLHIQENNGDYPLDNYIEQNDFLIFLPEEYEKLKEYWSQTKFWSIKYKFNDKFVYLKDHSDRSYNIIEVEDLSELMILDEDGNEIDIT